MIAQFWVVWIQLKIATAALATVSYCRCTYAEPVSKFWEPWIMPYFPALHVVALMVLDYLAFLPLIPDFGQCQSALLLYLGTKPATAEFDQGRILSCCKGAMMLRERCQRFASVLDENSSPLELERIRYIVDMSPKTIYAVPLNTGPRVRRAATSLLHDTTKKPSIIV